MRTHSTLLISCIIVIIAISARSQNYSANLEVIYKIDGTDIDFYQGDRMSYGGGIALEYHQNKLYLVTLTKLIRINLSDSSHIPIDLHGLYTDTYGSRIKDISRFGDSLYIIDNIERLVVIHNDTLFNWHRLDFSNLKLQPGGYVSRQYLFYSITSVDGELYFGNLDYVFPYRHIKFAGYKSFREKLVGRRILANSETKSLVKGIPLSDCLILSKLERIFDDSLRIIYNLIDYCSDTTYQKHRVLQDPFKKLFIRKNLIFKNSYLGDYYVIFTYEEDYEDEENDIINFGIIYLDKDLNLKNMVYPIPPPEGHLDFDIGLVFTHDQQGNIYYLSTKFEKPQQKSFVEFYRIRIK
jgi:hypothetical protein